jgi:hypothetical protein
MRRLGLAAFVLAALAVLPTQMNAALVTITFGDNGTAGFTLAANGNVASFPASTFPSGGLLTLTVIPGGGSNPTIHSGGTSASNTPGIGVNENELNGSESLTLTFSGQVTLVSFLITNSQSGGGASGDGGTVTSNGLTPAIYSGNFYGAPAGGSYNAVTEQFTYTISGGNLGSVFTFTANDGNDDYYLRSITFNTTLPRSPEPSTLLMLGGGLAAVAYRMRKRKAVN